MLVRLFIHSSPMPCKGNCQDPNAQNPGRSTHSGRAALSQDVKGQKLKDVEFQAKLEELYKRVGNCAGHAAAAAGVAENAAKRFCFPDLALSNSATILLNQP